MLAQLLCLLSVVTADLYMQSVRGSNNRLDEQGRNRHNGNRLFDSQNNNRGGYNVGKVTYYVGETVDVNWTNQHSCGDYQLENCELVVQYKCGELVRDGTVTRTIPDKPLECRDFNCDTDVKFGRHESYAQYQTCKGTKRNTGLFTVGQNLKGTSAKYTRQNPNGARRGYECPEERDYYPYWNDNGGWVDLAVMTNQPGRCAYYTAESQNVKARGRCQLPESYVEKQQGRNNRGYIPITKAECEKIVVAEGANLTNAVWVDVPAYNVPPPACTETQVSRTNHHGIVGTKDLYTMKWKVPAQMANNGNCVIRMRYNITTRDYAAWANANTGGVGAAKADNALKPCRIDNAKEQGNTGLAAGNTFEEAVLGACQTNRDGSIRTRRNLNPDRDPAVGAKVWEDVGLTFAEVKGSFANYNSNNQDLRDPNNNNNDAKRARESSRGYVFKNNPVVDPIGAQRAVNGIQTSYVRLRLAINTNQFGRTFQDRTHTFNVKAAPSGVGAQKIQLITVQGKRGNIVQVYPATEYFFIPEVAQLKPNEFAHFCWTGSNTNPNNNDGQGKRGTDRSNIVVMSGEQFKRAPAAADKYLYQLDNTIDNLQTTGDPATLYPAWVTKPAYKNADWDPSENPRQQVFGAAQFAMGGVDENVLKFLATQRRGDNLADAINDDDYGNMEELDDAGTTFCMEPQKVVRKGCWNYVSTRNNNFSNRSQKGTMCVQEGEVNSGFFPTKKGGLLTDQENQAMIKTEPGVFARAVTLEMKSEPIDDPKAASALYSVAGMQESDLEPEKSYTLRIPMTPEALTKPQMKWRAGQNQGEWTNIDADFTQEGGTNYGTAHPRQPGLFKVENEPDTLAIVAISFGCVAFAGVLGAVIFMKCRPKDVSSVPQDSSADL